MAVLYGNARPENFPDVNDYRNPVIAEALRVMGYVDKVTVFSVNVTNAKAENVSAGTDATLDAKELMLPDKSLKILKLCSIGSHTKKEMLHLIGVTYQTVNVRNMHHKGSVGSGKSIS